MRVNKPLVLILNFKVSNEKRYLFAAAVAAMLSMSSCSGFLDTKPDTLLTQDQTFGDPELVKSVLANFYGRVTIGQRIDDWDQWTMLDEVIHYDTNDDQNIDRNKWRNYDYTLVHDLNQFLEAIKPSAAVDEATKTAYMGEVRYIRRIGSILYGTYFGRCAHCRRPGIRLYARHGHHDTASAPFYGRGSL